MSKGRRHQQPPIPTGRKPAVPEERNESIERAWDSVNEVSEDVRQLLLQAGQLQPILTDPALTALISDQKELSEHRAIISRDVPEYGRQWRALRDQHTSRSGRAKDMDETFAAMNLHQEYLQLTESYQITVIPSIKRLGEMYQEAQENQNAQQSLTET